jgi:hypothetical protein
MAGSFAALTERFGDIDAANVKHAHTLIESGQARRKLVLKGWK